VGSEKFCSIEQPEKENRWRSNNRKEKKAIGGKNHSGTPQY